MDDDPQDVIARARRNVGNGNYGSDRKTALLALAAEANVDMSDRTLLTVAARAGQARWATAQRNEAIRKAKSEDKTLREIGAAGDLSAEGVRRITDLFRGGE